MKALSEALRGLPEFEKLLHAIRAGNGPVSVTGLGPTHRAHVVGAVRELTGRPVVVICSDEGEATRFAQDVENLIGEKAALLTAREFTWYSAAVVSREWEHRRLAVLDRMARGEAGLVVAAVDGLMQRTLPKETLAAAALTLSVGETRSPERLLEHLIRLGYARCGQVEGEGQFSLRGGILDFFSPGSEYPVRMEFFGDEVDSMGYFDKNTQRRVENISEARLLPAAEAVPGLCAGGHEEVAAGLEALIKKVSRRKGDHSALLSTLGGDLEKLRERRPFPAVDRYLELIYPQMTSGADYIPPDAAVFFSESGRVREKAGNYTWRLEQDAGTLLESGTLAGELSRMAYDFGELTERLASHPVVMMEPFTLSEYPLPPKLICGISAKQLPSYGGSLETAVSDLEHYARAGFRAAVFCSNRRRAEALRDMLEERGLPAALDLSLDALPRQGAVTVAVGMLSAGMEYPGLKLAVLSEGQLLGGERGRKRRRKAGGRDKLGSYADLSPGDLVVHLHHGVGRFVEMVKMPVDGVEKDYIKIAYAGNDTLYVPATQLDMVSKYIGAGEAAPARLNKLGGTEWNRAKSKAKGAAKELARGLIELYARRLRQKGHAFAPDSVWQTEFEEAFEYTETDDQLRCADEVKRNMEVPVPMDRLLCGDVGYGKTEVALRAVMKCVLDGKQAAILVPTTVLAQQHYVTAVNRFHKYPVRIDVLSRFRTPGQMRETLRRTREGAVDLLIGTHRLLQKDVVFRDLGLLIIDEEQRFGVSHKERLKEISQQVDVLTLTATPIPRTLNMALTGIRDISVLEEPPQDRQPVQTYVLEHDWGIVEDAIRRELNRGGQVYYLHNRVETIERTAARISAMVPDARVAAAHGKMNEELLSDIMQQMSEGEIQVLVCTTIIETGIDIPNVNTLIIEDADRLGLAQLHQIRGRVGRSSRHAFAYMTFRQGKVLSEAAGKRLSAIREFAEFGSGFKIAMRDLEIRGAGNLLGPEQSGYMMSVGYDMYLKLLEEAVLEEKGEPPRQSAECSADLTVSANIPEQYVPSNEQRIDLYRRIAQIRTEEDARDMVDELIDRFGDPPASVDALISVALLRAAAAAAGISEIAQKNGTLLFTLTAFDLQRISAVCSRPEYKRKLLFSAGETPYFSLRLAPGEDVLEAGRALVAQYARTEAETETERRAGRL